MPLARSPSSVDPVAHDSAEALALSAQLMSVICNEIDRAGGWIRFTRFMELALYAPGLGYYSAGATKIGRDPADGSDFTTAPELTPLFGRALARPVADVLADGVDTVVELGGGSGRLAVDLLLALDALGALPDRYLLLEVSADLRERQRVTLERDAPQLRSRVRWIDRLPERINAVVIGNEVLDALPVDLIVWTGDAWRSRGVVRGEQQLVFADRPLSDDLVSAVDATPGLVPFPLPLPSAGYVTEISLAARALVTTLVERMSDASVLLMLDYGFPASEYYHSQRTTGTLMAHRRHRASVDVLRHVGLQDITAHVDFSAVADAARAAGAATLGYTSQANFLIDCGIASLLTGDASDVVQWVPQASALQRLLSEAEMGELFKAIALGRRSRSISGFGRNDRSASL